MFSPLQGAWPVSARASAPRLAAQVLRARQPPQAGPGGHIRLCRSILFRERRHEDLQLAGAGAVLDDVRGPISERDSTAATIALLPVADVVCASDRSTLGKRTDLVHLLLAELLKSVGNAHILLQVRYIRDAHNRGGYGVPPDVGQQFLGAKALFDESPAGDHFRASHADLVLLGQAEGLFQVFRVIHDLPAALRVTSAQSYG